MYLEHFKLATYPFADVPDPHWYVPHSAAESAYADMVYSIMREDALISLDGGSGCGKTMLLNRLVQELDDSNEVHFVSFSALTFEQILAYVVDRFDASASDGGELVSNVQAVQAYLREIHAQGKRSVLLVDDAHLIDTQCLQQLVLLSNYVVQGVHPMTLVLAGDFSSAGGVPAFVQDRTRFDSVLTGLKEKDVVQYCNSRWDTAGASTGLKADESALQAAHSLSKSNVRRFGQMMDAALSVAGLSRADGISRAVMIRALARFGGEPAPADVDPIPLAKEVAPELTGTGLMISDGSGKPEQSVPLAEGSYSIGRADDCDIQLTSSHVSRYHARVEIAGNKATLIDLGSVNKAIVNGVPVSSHQLVNGDEIQLGEFVLRFISDV